MEWDFTTMNQKIKLQKHHLNSFELEQIIYVTIKCRIISIFVHIEAFDIHWTDFTTLLLFWKQN